MRALGIPSRGPVSLLVTVAVPALVAGGATASGADYVITPGDAQTVGFESKAPLETFQGRTHEVSGHLSLDPVSIGEAIDLEVRVDLASLDTGLGMRNRHMRENHLHTDRFPFATFRGGAVTEGGGTDLRDGEPHQLTVSGRLDLHGVDREVSISMTLLASSDDAGEAVRITCEFPVVLSDYDIPRPRFLFAKLGDVQRVFVEILAQVAPGEEAVPSDGEGTADHGVE